MLTKHFRRAVMKKAITEIVELAENEVGAHLDEVKGIIRELSSEELVVYQRRLKQLLKAVQEVRET